MESTAGIRRSSVVFELQGITSFISILCGRCRCTVTAHSLWGAQATVVVTDAQLSGIAYEVALGPDQEC
jgi:hypothetical protein